MATGHQLTRAGAAPSIGTVSRKTVRSKCPVEGVKRNRRCAIAIDLRCSTAAARSARYRRVSRATLSAIWCSEGMVGRRSSRWSTRYLRRAVVR